MRAHGVSAGVIGAGILVLACSVTEGPASGDPAGGSGKADGLADSEQCPADVALNAGVGSAKRCFDAANGRFVATECCADLCAGAGIREQSNGDRCAWLETPGLPGATKGQFAPAICCELNEELACGRGEGERGDCEDARTGRTVADVCCEPAPDECHPSVASSILSCVFDQSAGFADAGEPVPNLLSMFDSCTTELEGIAAELDQRCAFQPELPFCGVPFEQVHADFIEPCATIERPTYDCALGLTFRDSTKQSHIAVIDESTLELDAARQLDALGQAQIIAAISQNFGAQLSLEEAFDSVDQGLVNVLELFDLGSNASFTAVEFGAGDNSFGAFFGSGTTDLVATINDGDISMPGEFSLGCSAPIGPGGNTCAATSDCADGFRCTGAIVNENPISVPLGLCIDQSFEPNDHFLCTELRECGPQGYCTGLLGSGAEGLCGPPWMFGQRENEATIHVPDGGSARSDVLVYGQASVPMGLEVTVFLFHDSDVQELQLELLIPGPSDGADEDRARGVIWPAEGLQTDDPTGGIVKIPVHSFSDEGINGKWTLLVTDTVGNGSAGGAFGWKLDYSSRFD